MAKTLKAGRNSYDPELLDDFVKRYEALEGERETEHAEYMNKCKAIRDDQAAVLDEAKDQGINKKALKAVLKQRALERRVERLRDDLEDDDQEALDQIRHALGDYADTPLGQAAQEAAAGVGATH